MKSRESFEEVYLALWEIRYSVRNVIPAKAVEECPEGKDLRPPCTEESELMRRVVNGCRVMQIKDVLPCTLLDFVIPFAS